MNESAFAVICCDVMKKIVRILISELEGTRNLRSTNDFDITEQMEYVSMQVLSKWVRRIESDSIVF